MGMSGRGAGKLSPTERTLKAMENPYVSIIGHPTGRLIQKRAPMDIDMTAVIEGAVRTGTMLEINAAWQRLDLKDVHVRQALAEGVMLAINTDAHNPEGLEHMRYGVMTARRGGARRQDILNCCTVAKLRKKLAAKRR
jgi:DNA polymerase (family 10)